MSACTRSHARPSRVRPATLAVFLLAALLLTACKGATNPGGTLGGNVVLAPGQSANVSPIAVELFSRDPFSAGATPGTTVTANGTATDAAFSFGDLGHGDFYIVAWKDNGDQIVNSGDLRGWYDGGVNGSGAPVAAVVHLLHGEKKSVTIQVSVIP